ncbi:hypothetical protein [Candidatus Palauibacter sp.]|uniref:hypothetical protein n=1 Tax=Candidatus Palauibacter sp. TaxID=3101350 RepID=UPI003B025649
MAVGTIPAHSVDVAGTATVPVAGYFSDPDGDALTYTGTSSNPAAATVSLDGATATVTGVARGSAVVTITAADPDGLQANQGFNVEVGSDAGQPATVTIFGLREVDDRTQAVDPSDVSGNISVLLDVQYNDETVTNVDLTLGDEVISCRGASSDAASPAGVVPGVAESGGSVELECFFDTDQVAGECMGMQMEPRFANGEHELGAQITTADGTVREALATQMITLKNSNYVMIDHNEGKSMVVAGVTYYGGPTTEDNVNTFDVCPVAFDGTMVGSIQLRGMTDTRMADGTAGTSLSFRAHRRASLYGEFWGKPRTDDEAPFTFTAHSDWNGRNGLSSGFGNDGGVEDINPDRTGSGGHWIIQDGPILDPDGVDISSKFVPSDAENNLTKMPDPIYFDFNAPRVTGESEVTVRGASIKEVYYSGRRTTTDGRSQGLWISEVSEEGSGGEFQSRTEIIAVGDCSISANQDTGRDGAGTAFEALFEDVNAIGDLPEDDPDSEDLSDDGGVQCYTAELQSITDPLGNARSLSNVRIQSANNFGVDKTPPEIDDLVPDEELVLKDDAMLTFEVEDPDLETGEPGSGIDEDNTWAYWGPNTSWSQRYFFSGSGDDRNTDVVSNVENGTVTIDTNTGNEDADKERRYVVVAAVHDNAVPPHRSVAVFTYTRDSKGPEVTLSASQGDIGNINTGTVTVGVAGTITDKNVIKMADLSIRMIAADAGVDACENADDLSQGRTGRVVRNKRDLENDTNKIEFDESFTIRKPTGEGAGPETYCFWLESADIAVAANGRGDGNDGNYALGTFSVGWPTVAAPPAGPTFKFHAAGAVTELDSLRAPEGAADSTYRVSLNPPPAASAFPIEMTIDAPATVTAVLSGGTGTDATQFGAPTDTLTVTLTPAHDLDITSELHTLTHKAKDFDNTGFKVRVLDDDFEITANTSSVRENDDAKKVAVTVKAGLGADISTDVAVTLGARESTGAAAADFTAASVNVTVDTTRMVTDTISVDAVDDALQNEEGEALQLTGPNSTTTTGAAYVKPAYITIHDDDPDIELSVDTDEFDESAGTRTVTVTATAKKAVGGITTIELAVLTAANTDNDIAASTATVDVDYTISPSTVTLTINGNETTATAEFTLTISDGTVDEPDETIVLWDDSGAAVLGGTALTVEPVTITIIDNDEP